MKNCLICKKIFNKPYKLSKKQWKARKYCSLQCFWVVTPLRGKGRHPWNYKGIGSKNKLERERFRKEIQKLIFLRDKWKCVLCKGSGPLQVDHIKPWAKYPKLRFKMENCRTLCMKCHYKITFNKEMPQNIKTWGHNFKGGKSL